MLPALDYHRPAGLGEAVELLERFGDEALALAGGTDVVVDLRRGARGQRHLVSLRDIPELRGIRVEGDTLHIGAMTTAAELGASPEVAAQRPELLEAVRVFAGPQIRNMATVGGNLCTAASCADLAPMLIALSARVRTTGRELPLEDLFRDVRATVLKPGEILIDVAVPVRRPGEGAAYEAFGQRAASFITVVGVAAFVRGDTNRIVLGAVAPTPVLLKNAGVEEARAAAAPISDVRGSAEHRRDLVEVLTRRALERARS